MKNKVFLVIDLEWNQPVPWLRSNNTPEKLTGEIIEIGAVKVIQKGDKYYLSEPFQQTVRPRHYTIMNKNVGRVINKKSSDLKKGISFSQAYTALLEWCEHDAVILCAWGNSDIDILKANLRLHKQSDKLGMDFLDVQPLFSKLTGHGSEQKSVAYALEFFHIPHDNNFHAAHIDAINTGKILKGLLVRYGKEEIVDILSAYIYDPDIEIQMKESTQTYPNVVSCFQNNKKRNVLCPICKNIIEEQISWFRMKNAAFYLGRCETHGFVSSRLRMKKNPDGKTFAHIITKRIYPGEADAIKMRYDRYMQENTAKKI